MRKRFVVAWTRMAAEKARKGCISMYSDTL